MRFPLFVALRFLREGRLQTGLILGGVGVGVAVIVFLSALIGGLQESLIDRTLGSQAHVVVRAPEEMPRPLRVARAGELLDERVERAVLRTGSIDTWMQVRETIARRRGVLAVSPVVGGAAFARAGGVAYAVALQGIEPEAFDRVVGIRDEMVAGRFEVGGGNAVIGVELARDLALGVGDKLRLSTAEVEAPEVLTVAGIFDLGNEDVNRRWVLVSLRQGQTLLELPGRVTALEVKVAEIFEAEAIARGIAGDTGLEARSWMETNAQLLTALRSQASSSMTIQFFVVVAVALGIASVLVVSVVQRSRQIGILKAMGASTGEVVQIFLIQGGIVGLIGSAVGILGGAALAWAFVTFVRTDAGQPLFPITIEAPLVLRTALLATATGILAAVAPARRAARLDPARAIHGD